MVGFSKKDDRRKSSVSSPTTAPQTTSSRIGEEHSTPIDDDFGVSSRPSELMPQNRRKSDTRRPSFSDRVSAKIRALGSDFKLQ